MQQVLTGIPFAGCGTTEKSAAALPSTSKHAQPAASGSSLLCSSVRALARPKAPFPPSPFHTHQQSDQGVHQAACCSAARQSSHKRHPPVVPFCSKAGAGSGRGAHEEGGDDKWEGCCRRIGPIIGCTHKAWHGMAGRQVFSTWCNPTYVSRCSWHG